MTDEASKRHRSEIEDLLRLSEDHLLAQLGEAVQPRGVGEKLSDLVGRGRATLDRIRGDLQRIVCVEWDFCSKRSDPSLNDDISLATAICDLISAACGILPVTTVAVLLVKRGLTEFCDCP